MSCDGYHSCGTGATYAQCCLEESNRRLGWETCDLDAGVLSFPSLSGCLVLTRTSFSHHLGKSLCQNLPTNAVYYIVMCEVVRLMHCAFCALLEDFLGEFRMQMGRSGKLKIMMGICKFGRAPETTRLTQWIEIWH